MQEVSIDTMRTERNPRRIGDRRMTKLKPCPFCGNDLCYVRSIGIETEVYCQNCTAVGPLHISSITGEDADNKAIDLWNTRAADRVAELGAQLKMVLEREAATQRRHEAREDAAREAALREAADVAAALSIKWWSEYKDRLSPHSADPHWQGMSDGADDVCNAILELIGEKNDG